MNAIFGDSTFYVALLINRDSHHAKAIEIARSFRGSVVTTEYVLNEVANHLSGSPARRARFGEFLADVKNDPNCTLVESAHELWLRGVDLYLRRPDKEWSLTDCISFVLMEEQGLTEALSADHHFEQAGFSALLIA